MPIRVVLADDQPLFLAGLESLLLRAGEVEVVGRCSSGRDALATVLRTRPDLLVLELRLRDLDGFGLLRELAGRDLPTRIVVLAAELDAESALEALRLGARGVLLKEMAPRLILECVRRVHRGETWIERRLAGQALERAARRGSPTELSAREVELVRLAAGGLRNREIAVRLAIAEGTVKAHLHNIYQKLHIDRRVALLRYADRHGLR
jgi:DNA-binding NarL/FixJ family response regulator